MDKILLLLQARSGSTRLPNKILLPFYDGKTILQIIIERLQGIEGADVAVATTDSAKDDALAEAARQEGVMVYRGSEDDVLDRFIQAAKTLGYTRIVRICSDNPFLDADSIRALVQAADDNPQADYISFDINGVPSIRTHYGFWAEYVTLEALERVAAATAEKLYHEHVTNYIYTHPGEYEIAWIAGPGALLLGKPIRLTIDTPVDFDNARMLYSELAASTAKFNIPQVVEAIMRHPSMLQAMKKEIEKNSK